MKKLIDPFLKKIRHLPMFRHKAYAGIAFIASAVLLPDIYLAGAHYMLGFLHIFYEGLCFMLEEFIGHSLNLGKYHSQLILFYSQVAIAAGFGYKIWRFTPRLYRCLKADVCAFYHQLLRDAKQQWLDMSGQKRVKVIFGCAAGIFGIYFWATS
jgi:hypothetical protein